MRSRRDNQIAVDLPVVHGVVGDIHAVELDHQRVGIGTGRQVEPRRHRPGLHEIAVRWIVEHTEHPRTAVEGVVHGLDELRDCDVAAVAVTRTIKSEGDAHTDDQIDDDDAAVAVAIADAELRLAALRPCRRERHQKCEPMQPTSCNHRDPPFLRV